MAKIKCFSEIQRLAKVWVLLILTPILIVCTRGLIGSDNSLPIILISSLGCLLAVSLLTLSIKTTIDETGINVLYIQLPFFLRKSIKWSDVETVQIRRYDGLYEFGGFNSPGIRPGRSGLVGYRIRGDMAIFVKTKKGKEILIGTQKPKSAGDYIKQLGQLTG